MIPNWIIKKWFDKANILSTDVMHWSDFLEALNEIKGNNVTNYTENPVAFTSLPEYADDAAATLGGLSEGTLYRTSGGEVRVKLPDV
jgi:hypothetical protein